MYLPRRPPYSTCLRWEKHVSRCILSRRLAALRPQSSRRWSRWQNSHAASPERLSGSRPRPASPPDYARAAFDRYTQEQVTIWHWKMNVLSERFCRTRSTISQQSRVRRSTWRRPN
ncbi:MAG: hypothetical protein ACRD34_01540 [Bryobacteraceae bacterium]